MHIGSEYTGTAALDPRCAGPGPGAGAGSMYTASCSLDAAAAADKAKAGSLYVALSVDDALPPPPIPPIPRVAAYVGLVNMASERATAPAVSAGRVTSPPSARLRKNRTPSTMTSAIASSAPTTMPPTVPPPMVLLSSDPVLP